jgi:5,10-methylenetetrahydromethanopterin reductase
MKFVFGAKPKAPMSAFVNLVRLGETLGFDGAWVPDQTFFPDPFVAIAMSATETSHIELVIGVANPYTRHPAQVARAAATLDDVAPGRIALAYGAGNRRELIVPLGGQQDRPAHRCREAIQVARRLLRGEKLHYSSETLVADGVQLEMPPHPDIPVYLAGRGPLTLQVAGELAEVAVIGALLSPDGIRYAVDQVRLGAERGGRRLNDVGLMSWISCYITDDKPLWTEFYRPNAAHILAGAPPQVFDALSLTNRFMEELKTIYAEGGSAAAAKLVPDDLVLQLAAIGDPGEVTEQLQSAMELGINQFGILVNASTVTESEQMLRRFSEKVMPNLKPA